LGLSADAVKRAAFRLVLPALLVCFASKVAFAFRPFDGTDASVADPGEVEIELQPVGYLRDGSDHALIAPAARINYGFAEDWEAVIEGQWSHGLSAGSATSSLAANAFSLKHVWRDGFLQEKPGPSVATEFALLLPGIGADNGTGGSVAGIVSDQLGWLTFHVNAVAAITRQQHGDLVLDSIFEGPREWTVRPVAEVFHELDFGGPKTTSGLVGAIWQAGEKLAFDAAYRRARSDGRTVDELRLGVTFAFGLR
jgi:hypothetical protein